MNFIDKVKKSIFYEFVMKVQENELTYLASELTLKIIVAMFPFLMFLIAVLGTLDLQVTSLINFFGDSFPDSIIDILNMFLKSISKTGSASSIMSVSLLVAIFSAASGFSAVNRGINKTYGVTENRNFIHKKIISVCQVLLFTFAIVLSMFTMIFGDVIINALSVFEVINFLEFDFPYEKVLSIIVFSIMTLLIMIIYSIGSSYKVKFISTLPGSIFTLIFWALSSKVYNIYINNFSKYSAVYGTLGTILIFIAWLNIISIVLLIGSQINAMIYSSNFYKNLSVKNVASAIKDKLVALKNLVFGKEKI